MDTVFDDTVKICEFYSSEEYPITVDWVGGYIYLGDDEFAISPIVGDDGPVYFVKERSGALRLVPDLDDYFQSRLPDWREEL